MSGLSSWNEYTRFLIGLVAVLDPFIAVPVFLSITADATAARRHGVARAVTLIVFAVLAGAALTGETVLSLMGGSLASFRVGGGIVLLLMGLAMLNARAGDVRQTSAEADELVHADGSGYVPLAVPLLAGPGAISTVIIAVHDGGWLNQLVVIVCIAAACAVLWAILRLAVPIGQRLGTTGMNVANRLLGLLLAAIAIETMATGLKALFPVLAGN